VPRFDAGDSNVELLDWLRKRLEHASLARSVDAKGRTDLRAFRRSAGAYARQHERAVALLASKAPLPPAKVSAAYRDRVNATWGLIARGADAIPFALKMLKSSSADAREDAGGILAEISGDDGVVGALLEQLRVETGTQARDSIIEALGALKHAAAIPALAAIIRDPDADGDTRWAAVHSLGAVARKRFSDGDNPVGAATQWLDAHGH
jgi:hypothetical protein